MGIKKVKQAEIKNLEDVENKLMEIIIGNSRKKENKEIEVEIDMVSTYYEYEIHRLKEKLRITEYLLYFITAVIITALVYMILILI